MALVAVNNATATLSANLSKSGRIVLFSPTTDFSPALPKTGWVDLGNFPTDATIAPTNNVTRTAVTARNREGGPDVTLTNAATAVTISYDSIPALTPDDLVRALHAGATPLVLAGTLAGVQAFTYDPTTALEGRMIIVQKRPAINGTRRHRVVFHPRVDLTNAGTGDSNGQETLIFAAAVTPHEWTPGGDLGATSFGQYGAQYEVDDTDLQALLTALSTAAPA